MGKASSTTLFAKYQNKRSSKRLCNQQGNRGNAPIVNIEYTYGATTTADNSDCQTGFFECINLIGPAQANCAIANTTSLDSLLE